MQWPSPFSAVDDVKVRSAIELRLAREVKPGHVLHGLKVATLGRREDQDDFLFELLDGTNRLAEVHLTFSDFSEPPFPWTTIFDDFEAWAESARKMSI